MRLPVLRVTAIDCPDPVALANFYAHLTGLAVEPLGAFPVEDVDWIELLDANHPRLGFQKVDHYVAPTWPEGPIPQQLHLDFYVDDLDEGQRHALDVGAVLAQYQPGTSFRVFYDPVGHPFCLVLDQAAVDDAVIDDVVESTLSDYAESDPATAIMTVEREDAVRATATMSSMPHATQA